MRLLVVDDHPMMREALRSAIDQRLEGDRETAFAGSLEEALAAFQRAGSFDLVLLDPGLPDATGLDALVRLRESHPDAPVVVVSGNDTKQAVLDAIELGAMAYVSKSMTPDEFVDAVRQVLAGRVYVPSAILRQISRSAPAPGIEAAMPGPVDPQALLALTPRQRDVLDLLLQGLPNKRIQQRLELSESTVKAHISAILRGLNAANRTQAVLVASRLGLRVGTAASGAAVPDDQK